MPGVAGPAGHVLQAGARLPWRASLNLGYQRLGGGTVPTTREHVGPLRVLKGYRQSGADCWEQVIVHPPGGIAACDELSIDVRAEENTNLLLTTPGASKWYKAPPGSETQAEQGGRQKVCIQVASGGAVEWMPLENIFYDGTNARLETEFELAPDAGLICADVYCLGRPASQALFESGRLAVRTRVLRGGQPLYIERIKLAGGGRVLTSPAGLGGHCCFGSLLAVPPLDAADGQRPSNTGVSELVEVVRESLASMACRAEFAVTTLPGVLIVRWRGSSAQLGWQVLHQAWEALRLPVLGRAAQAPRIWAC